MDEHSRKNLAEIVARFEDRERAKAGLQQDRARIARVLREARARVKANKAKNGGFYSA